MPHDFDNTWGIVKDLGLAPSVFYFNFLIYLLSVLISSFFYFFPASVLPIITDE